MITQDYIDKLKARLSAVESAISSPDAAANKRKFQELVREHNRLRRIAEKADAYARLARELEDNRGLAADATSDPELAAMATEEVQRLEVEAPRAERDLMVEMLPPDPSDARNVIMEIRAGTGGEEAALFAADLFRMYSRYSENRGWKVGVIDGSPSSVGGYKELLVSIEGEYVYRTLKYESGCHRVQRVPATEAQGRIHTSTATVAVLPEADEIDEIVLNPADLRIDIFCSSGPGGQSVNTTYSAIRVTHLPTGIVAQSQDERSQQRNREKALNVLKARLLDVKRQEEEKRLGDERRSQIGTGDRSERIRTYNFPQNRLTDHRINLTSYNLNRVVEGEIGPVLEALRDHDVELRLKKEMASA